MAEEKEFKVSPYPLENYWKHFESEQRELIEAGNKQLEILKDLTIKTITVMLLLNGGAAVACMGFWGSLLPKLPVFATVSFREPLFCFAFGSVMAGLIAGGAYFSQSYYCRSNDFRLGVFKNQAYSNLLLDKIEFYDNQLKVASKDYQKILIIKIIRETDSEKNMRDSTIKYFDRQADEAASIGNTCRDMCIVFFATSIFLFCAGVIKMGTAVINL